MNRDPSARLDGPLGFCLAPVGFLFGKLTRMRAAAYRRGWLKSHRPPMPTLSIGNLSAGGTGKTPLLFDLLQRLKSASLRAGVLSRGYGGDEGRILEERHPEVLLAEDPDRVRALQQFLLEDPPELLILDDGFQHLRLLRDLDVVLLDGLRPFGRCFPAGFFREPRAALRRADLVVVTRTDLAGRETVEAVWREVEAVRRGLPPLPRVEGTVVVRDLRNLRTGEVRPASALQDMPALVAAGIGNPRSFEQLCLRAGVEVLEARFPGDHHAWTEADQKDWDRFPNVLVTEKDGVKLRDAVSSRVWEVRVDWS
ncbi:MAG: tetraacyldisaccharide 4'-kinase, partial [Planctomycetota bacterium]